MSLELAHSGALESIGYSLPLSWECLGLVNCPCLLPGAVLLFSHSFVSDSFRPPGLQHARLPCPSPSPRVCSDPCPLSQWCHPGKPGLEAPFMLSCAVPSHSHTQVYPCGSLEKVGNIFPGLQGTWAVSMSPPTTRAEKEHLPKVPTAPF